MDATIKTELDSFKAKLETRTKEERLNYNRKVIELTAEFDKKLEEERAKIMHHFEVNVYVLVCPQYNDLFRSRKRNWKSITRTN